MNSLHYDEIWNKDTREQIKYILFNKKYDMLEIKVKDIILYFSPSEKYFYTNKNICNKKLHTNTHELLFGMYDKLLKGLKSLPAETKSDSPLTPLDEITVKFLKELEQKGYLTLNI
jgi:hypothetical protein